MALLGLYEKSTSPVLLLAKMSPLGSPRLSATTAQLSNRTLRRLLVYGFTAFALCSLLVSYGRVSSIPQHGVLATSKSTAPAQHPAFPPTRQPAKVRSDFPKKIWQVWKVNPLEFEERDHNVARSWVQKNPDYRYEVLTDGNELAYVEYHFGPEGFDRPDIVEFYKSVKAAIVRADLLRYMIMYAEGGVYADIDVEALKPMRKFIPERYDHRDIDLVIGVEIDEPDWRDHPILGPKSRSFCQWTFMAKPQQPVMMRLIEQIMTWLRGIAERQGVSISDVKLDFDDIITGTGPSAFTEAILAEMNAARAPDKEPLTWDAFHDLGESRLVSRFLVLTVEAFAAGQGHSDSGNHDARAALVRHHYHASNWPSRHPRYKHPAYGEVEQCNWNDECVHQWDENVAKFKTLPEEEQKRIIEEKERERKEKKEREEEEERRRKEEEEKRRREEEDRKRREEDERRRKEEEKTKLSKEGPPPKAGPPTKEEAAKGKLHAKR